MGAKQSNAHLSTAPHIQLFHALCLVQSSYLRKNPADTHLIRLILVSWGIAFFEYCFMVPANNIFGKREGFSAFQLKPLQEVISLLVFALFAVLFPGESIRWNYIAAFLLITGAVYLMFYPFSR